VARNIWIGITMAARKAQKKSYVKYIIGPGQPTPKPKPSKTPYVKSKPEPELQAGRTTKAKVALQKAINGGAAKTAKKLAPRDVINYPTTTKVYVMGKNRSQGISEIYAKPTKSTSPRQKAKRNMIANNIINDLSKTAMRAKIVEMNVAKKRNKKKK
jgi:hypothetical protein